MKVKKRGGINYKFDVLTLGKLSVEREYNNNINIIPEDKCIVYDLNAFAHSLDFVSKKHNIWNTPNVFNFIVKSNVKSKETYFIDGIKKICDKNFLDLLVNIYFNENLINIKKKKIAPENKKELYDDLIKNIKTIVNLIIYDDFSLNPGNIIIQDENKDTKEFLDKIKKLYGEKYQNAKIGGVGSEDEPEEFEVESMYIPIIEFQKYENIKAVYANYVTGDFFDYMTIIIGFCNIFRYSGIFNKNSVYYKSVNKLYHCLLYFDFAEPDITTKMENIDELFYNATIILLKVADVLHNICTNKYISKYKSRETASSIQVHQSILSFQSNKNS
tara:strand:- start:10732 stop:11721 length:990 start_codon:yes stop_codon:yes gene_type:complete